MNDLIQQLEQATEGSRELDARVGIAAKHFPNMPPWVSEWEGPIRPHPRKPGRIMLFHDERIRARKEGAHWSAPHYTTSLDAALTLVPEGWSPSMISWSVPALVEQTDVVRASVVGNDEKNFPDGRHEVGNAATPALALCIAALKAIEAEKTNE